MEALTQIALDALPCKLVWFIARREQFLYTHSISASGGPDTENLFLWLIYSYWPDKRFPYKHSDNPLAEILLNNVSLVNLHADQLKTVNGGAPIAKALKQLELDYISIFPVMGSHDEPLGLLVTAASQDEILDDGPSQKMTQLLCRQAVLQLENERLTEKSDITEAYRREQELEQQTKRLEALNQASRAISSALSLPEVVETILSSAKQVVQSVVASILLRDSDNPDELIYVATVGPYAETRHGQRIPLGHGIPGWVAFQAQPLLIQDVANDPLFGPDTFRDPHLNINSVAAVPLKSSDTVIGVLEVINKELGVFNEGDLAVLESLGASAAVAIHNASLHDQTQRRLTELGILLEASEAVSTTMEFEIILEHIISRLRETLDIQRTLLITHDVDRNRWISRAEVVISIPSNLHDTVEIRRTTWDNTQGPAWDLEQYPIMQSVVSEGQPYFVLVDNDKNLPGDQVYLRSMGVGGCLIVPLITYGQIVGLLLLMTHERRPFDSSEFSLCQGIANIVANALENVNLYSSLDQRAKALEKAYRELEDNDRIKDQLLQNLSHELSTPLTHVLGYMSLLIDGHFGELNVEQLKTSELVIQKSQRIADLVKDIIAAHSTSSGMLDFATARLEQVATLAARSLSGKAESANIRILLRAQPNLPSVTIDRVKITEVFEALIDNAIKFSEGGSSIEITIVDTNSPMVQVSVRDEGIGIPPEEHERIFRRFYQVDGSTTRQYGGTGLGLAIAANVIKGHGGKIWVESEVGQGACFFFTIPKATSLAPVDRHKALA